MAEEIKELTSELDGLSSSVDQLIARSKNVKGSFDEVAASSSKALNSIKKYNDLLSGASGISRASAKAVSDYNAALGKQKSAMDGAVKEAKAYRKAQGDLKRAMDSETASTKKSTATKAKQTTATREYRKAIRSTRMEVRGFSSAMTKLVGALGVGTVSFKSLWDSTVQYNESLMALGRAQSSVGGSMSDLSSVIDDVGRSTVFSKQAFVDFASSMTLDMIGPGKSAEEWRDYAKVLQTQVGGSEKSLIETGKKLLQIHNKFPALHDQIIKGMKIRKKMDDGTATKAEIAFNDALQRTIPSLFRQIDLSQSLGKEAVGWLKKRTAAEKEAMAVAEAQANTQKAYKDAILALGQAALPVFMKIAEWLTKVLEIVQKSPKGVMALVASFLTLKAGISTVKGASSAMKALGLVTGATGKEVKLMTKSTGRLAKMFPKLFAGATTKAKGLSVATKGLGGAFASLGPAVAIAGAAFAGFTVGTKLDEIFGWSDKLAGVINKISGATPGDYLEANNKEVAAKLEELRDKYRDKSEEIDKIWSDLTKDKQGNMSMTITLEKAVQAGGLEELMANSKSGPAPDEGGANIDKIIQSYKVTLESQKVRLDLIEMEKKSIGGLIKLAEESGRVDKERMKQNLDSMKKQEGMADVLLKKSLEKATAQTGVKVDLSKGSDLTTVAAGAIRDISAEKEALAIAKEELANGTQTEEVKSRIADIVNKELQLQTTLVDLSKDLESSTNRRMDVIKSIFDISKAEMRQQEQFSSMYEKRLDTERKLQESAQFGLGASVTMMQKQVDLAHEFMKMYQNTDKEMANTLVTTTKITDTQIDAVKQAKSQGEAQKIVSKFTGLTKAEQNGLLQYAAEHQDITAKQMQQQQKIYDLTKEVREGYLDAIREMSVGAGEFTKIIGTQDMGVTQLMGSVEDVTGVAKLNTMALGGLQEQSLTQEGVGTQAAYKYTTGGLAKGISKEQEKQQLGRIYKYEESVDKAKSGEIEGKMGTAVAASEKDKDALREGGYEGTKQGVIEGMAEATKDWSHGLRGDGRDLPGKDKPDPGRPNRVTALGMQQAAAAKGQVADTSGGPTLAKGAMPMMDQVMKETGASKALMGEIGGAKSQSELQSILRSSGKTKVNQKILQQYAHKKIDEETARMKEANKAAGTNVDIGQKVKVSGGTKIYGNVRGGGAEGREKAKTDRLLKAYGITQEQLAGTGYKDPKEALNYLMSSDGTGQDMLTSKQRVAMGLEGAATGSTAEMSDAVSARLKIGKLGSTSAKSASAKSASAKSATDRSGKSRLGEGLSRGGRGFTRLEGKGPGGQLKRGTSSRSFRGSTRLEGKGPGGRLGKGGGKLGSGLGGQLGGASPSSVLPQDSEHDQVFKSITRSKVAGKGAVDFSQLSGEEYNKMVDDRNKVSSVTLEQAKKATAAESKASPGIKTQEVSRMSKEQEKVASAESQQKFKEERAKDTSGAIGADGSSSGDSGGANLSDVVEKLDAIKQGIDTLVGSGIAVKL